MRVLGIESTAHTFGASVIDLAKEREGEKAILSDEKSAFSTEEGGMVPGEVADHHVEAFDRVIRDALAKAGVRLRDVDLVAYSKSPGLGHTLRVGAMAARSIALLANRPLVGVNHCIAHLEIARLVTDAKDPVLLYASGANTQIIAYEAGRYRIFGETLDMGAGNFLDQFARALGLGFPGGPRIDALAKEGDEKGFIELPYTVKGMDVSFGGLLTRLKHLIREGKRRREDLCYSVQETVFAMLLEVSERAMAHCDKDELVLGGGVACNGRLQEMAKAMCAERGARIFIPARPLLADNAAMIAYLGGVMHRAGISDSVRTAGIAPYERTDDVAVTWR
ncbi:tRNA (adenosine(37)-N6)-threonylcarbamoyltransferase complex transferase subunit TsaD [Candidatus Woesearchaeota archaeon]|nr:tRNA (adenosine(37)-N6)-threonylcarbamoyltransferase complex transferase subunit TsaD [Candidatus Woesearchaeota archaeon]